MTAAAEVVDAIVDALDAQHIPLNQYYPELGHGQHELSVLPRPALAAADTQVLVRETIRGVAARCGLVASLAPKPWPDQAGNGAHVHFSAWQDERNLFHDPTGRYGLSTLAEQFVAGILAHTPGLLALTAPSFNSFARLLPQHWSSAFVCWGPDNREATVRVPSTFWGDEAASTNLEYKPADASANPYLAFGGLIAAGLDGIERELVPPPPIDIDPADLSDDARDDAGIARYPDHAGRGARRPRSRRAPARRRWATRWPARTSRCAGRSRRRTPRRLRSSPSPTTSRSTDVAAVDGLRPAIAEIAAIDQHAHLLDHADAAPVLHDVLSESRDPAQRELVRQQPAYRRALRELGRVARRRSVGGGVGRGPPGRLRLHRPPAWRRAVSTSMFVDDGFRSAGTMSLDEHAAVVPCPVRRVVRIESEAEAACAGWPPFQECRSAFQQAITAARRRRRVGLKTIAAYRCGLDLPAPSLALRSTPYEAWRRSGSSRLRDAAWCRSSSPTRSRRLDRGVPLQVHTGLGDADQSLLGADPALLQPQLDHGFSRRIPVVLLHCYPFVRHAGYLASIYRDVHVDLSLALTLVPQRGPDLVAEALELTPPASSCSPRMPPACPRCSCSVRDGGANRSPERWVDSSTTASPTNRVPFTGPSRSSPATPAASTATTPLSDPDPERASAAQGDGPLKLEGRRGRAAEPGPSALGLARTSRQGHPGRVVMESRRCARRWWLGRCRCRRDRCRGSGRP